MKKKHSIIFSLNYDESLLKQFSPRYMEKINSKKIKGLSIDLSLSENLLICF
jgi:hypothetical protein